MEEVIIHNKGGKIMTPGIIHPETKWPVVHLNSAAGISELLPAPGISYSYFLDGFYLSGGGDADGFHILRRSCLSLIGTTDYVTVGDNAALQPAATDFNISVWVRIDQSISDISKIIHKDNGSDNGYFLELSSGYPKFTYGDGSHTASVTGITSINDGSWHHIAVTVDVSVAQGLNIYIDGELDATTEDNCTAITGPVVGVATDLTIYGVNTYRWYISGAALFAGSSAAWSASEVSTIYNSGVGAKWYGGEDNISWAMNLDEGTGLTAYDITGGANNGTITNCDWAPSKRVASTAALEVGGCPFDDNNALGTIGKFSTGVLTTQGVYVPTGLKFPHSIRIGRNCPLSILETGGAWSLILFGHTDNYQA